MSNFPLNSIRRFVNNGRVLRIAGMLLAALIISSCEEYPTPYQPGLYPRAAPAGFWNDEGASGKPRIIVHIGEQSFQVRRHAAPSATGRALQILRAFEDLAIVVLHHFEIHGLLPIVERDVGGS